MERRRLLVLARTLREFGIVDKFGIAESLQKQALPTRDRLARMIKNSGNLLPPGITATFLADSILNEQRAAEQSDSNKEELLKLVRSLKKIPKGKRAATKYQKAMLEIFRLLFQDRLGAMKLEDTIFAKTKRVDIRAKNNQAAGFFAELRTRFGFRCPRLFFECKNYKEDPENPEFDQLLGRLNKTSTQVGFILCRNIRNADKALERCKQAFLRDDKVMLWLTDADVTQLANALVKDGLHAVDALLEERLEAVTVK